jgi:hypothetical protein
VTRSFRSYEGSGLPREMCRASRTRR